MIGTWSSEQPADPTNHAIAVGETIWHFADEYVSLAPFDAHMLPWEEQARIAQESLKRAQEQERLEQFADAQSLYAQTLVELEASGKTADELVDLRTKRAFLLEHLDQAAEAVAEFGRVARVYEANAFLPGSGTVDRAYAELAAQALNAMGRTILHHADPGDETWQHKLRQIVDRIHKLLPYLSRRYVDNRDHDKNQRLLRGNAPGQRGEGNTGCGEKECRFFLEDLLRRKTWVFDDPTIGREPGENFAEKSDQKPGE